MSLGTLLFMVLVGLLGYFIFRFRRRMQHWQNMGVPCDEPHPFYGNLTGVMDTRSFSEIWMYYYNKYRGSGPFAGFYWTAKPAAFILEPFLVKRILIKDFNKFSDRGFFSNPENDPLSGQLFLLDGHRWKSMRQKLSPTFTAGKIKIMFPTVVRVCQEFMDVLDGILDKSSTIEVKELLARFTTDVIGTCAFGIDCNSLKDPEAEFRIMGVKALNDRRHSFILNSIMHLFPKLARRLHAKQTPEHVEKFFIRVVRETISYREQNNIKRNDIMDLLIDLKNNTGLKTDNGQSKNLTIEEIAAQAFVFFAAGYETSSTTMGLALYELAQHQDIQQRVRDECNVILSQTNGELKYERLKEMTYLNQVISETLRLYSIFPVLNRECLEDYVVPGYPNYVIKKGTLILIPVAAMHRDKRFYPNPDRFNPDHFEEKRVKNRDSVEWLPFGDGPRNCIGMRFAEMQIRIGLSMLLTKFKFSVCETTSIPMQYDKKSFLLATESGIYLRVERV